MTYEEIHKRFLTAAKIIFEGNHGSKKAFCEKYKIPYANFTAVLKEASTRRARSEWIASFCEEYNFSIEWIMLGKGKALRP